MIILENVDVKRNGSMLLKDINLHVKKGEHLVLFGLNGSGKSTLLQLITGYLWPSNGKVTILGKQFGKYPLHELRKSIGIVSSAMEERLYDDTAENIVISGKYASVGLYIEPDAGTVEKALELMDTFGCSHLKGRSYHTLSQGEKQKILVARALMTDPKILILDEPCVGLDVLAREQVLNMIATISEQEETPALLYVTHHVEEILPLFHRMALMKEGTIEYSGDIKNMMTSEVLTGFLDTPVKLEKREERYFLSFRQGAFHP